MANTPAKKVSLTKGVNLKKPAAKKPVAPAAAPAKPAKKTLGQTTFGRRVKAEVTDFKARIKGAPPVMSPHADPKDTSKRAKNYRPKTGR